MRAARVEEFGPVDSHKFGDLPDPKPGPGEVLIDVHAIGVNFPDSLLVQGLYQVKPEHPFSPGRDAAGVVTEIGDGVTSVKIGDRVVTVYSFGAYAEQRVVPQERCFHLPDDVDFVTGAGMATTYLTAWVALMGRGAYQTGEKVLVLGASGGVGLAAVQIAKAHGAFVVAGTMDPAKSGDIIKASGADAVVCTVGDDLVESFRKDVFAVTDGFGVDICLDSIGGELFTAALRTLAFAGRIVAIGFIAGIPTARANYFNVKDISLVGMGLDLHFKFQPQIIPEAAGDLFDLLAKGQIKPQVTDIYPLEEYTTALSRFGSNKSNGKMVLTTGRG